MADKTYSIQLIVKTDTQIAYSVIGLIGASDFAWVKDAIEYCIHSGMIQSIAFRPSDFTGVVMYVIVNRPQPHYMTQ